MAQLVARLQLPDGREFDVHTEVAPDTESYPGEHPFHGTLYYWTEGNLGCDCNRTLYLNREHGLNLVREPEDDCWPCGDTITLLSLTVDGRDLLGDDAN